MKKYCRRIFPLILSITLLTGLLLPVTALALTEPMEIASTAAILFDADYGEVLYDQNAHAQRYPASITKVMTALLTLEAIDRGELTLDTVITVQATALSGLSLDGSSQNIQIGEQLTVEQLLYCTLVASANEACNVLAEAVSGSAESFVEQMNKRAAELGMEDTHFANTHGLHKENHYTTAYDICLMAIEALKHDTFREIVGTPEYRVPATNLYKERHFYSTNALLSNWRYIGYTYTSAIGVKTGSTPEAGQCLVSAAVEDGRTFVAVVLGAENIAKADGTFDRQAFSESKRLLQFGFHNFSRKTIIDSTALLTEVAVTLSDEAAYVVAHPDGKLEATLPNDVVPEAFEREITLYAESVEAPVEKGQVLGTVSLTYEGKNYGTLNLVAVSSVARSELLYNIARIKAFLGQLWVKLLILVIILLVLFLLVRHFILGKKNRKRRNRYSGYGGGSIGGRTRRRR